MTIRAQGWGEVVPEDELAEILLLTVDKRNARGNKSQAVLDTLFQLMNDAGPALTEEETKLIDDFLQYRIVFRLRDREELDVLSGFRKDWRFALRIVHLYRRTADQLPAAR